MLCTFLALVGNSLAKASAGKERGEQFFQPLPAAGVSFLGAPQCLCWIQISLRELRTLPLWDSGVYGQAPKSRHGFWLPLGSLRISKIELSLKREHDFHNARATQKITFWAPIWPQICRQGATFRLFSCSRAVSEGTWNPLGRAEIWKKFFVFWRSGHSAGKG